MSNEKLWLERFEASIPNEIRSSSIIMYYVALEGWRRGLKLKFINNNHRVGSKLNYSLVYRGKEQKFDVSNENILSDVPKGDPIDVIKMIIDSYFPETRKNRHNDKPLYYFDLKFVYDNLKNGHFREFTIPDYPEGELVSTTFIVSGQVQHVGYGRWIRKKARNLSLNGFVKHFNNGSTSIVVSGPTKKVDEFREIIRNETPDNVKVTKIVEKNRKSPIKIGFEIINLSLDRKLKVGNYPVKLYNIKSNNKVNNTTEHSKKIDYEKENKKLINSTSWKITKPLRYIGKIFR